MKRKKHWGRRASVLTLAIYLILEVNPALRLKAVELLVTLPIGRD